MTDRRPGLWELHRGDGPLVIDIPHSGTHLPDAMRERLTPVALTFPDTDWHVERLYAFARDEGATVLGATHSRYVVDLNRDPSGQVLYAGADNTELCPTRTFANEPIYRDGASPTPAEIAERVATYFAPYHATLAGELDRVRQRHGFAILLDGHSIRAEVPRFFPGRLPDLNLGTADGASCAASLQDGAAQVLAAAEGFTHVVNGRFKGGWITRHYGRPADGIHALQLEMAQDCYMDEAPPFRWDEARAGRLATALQWLVRALSKARLPT